MIAGSCVTTNSGMTGSYGTVSSWAAGSCVTTKFWEEVGSCVIVMLFEGNATPEIYFGVWKVLNENQLTSYPSKEVSCEFEL
jgi:hypothetical protein